MIDLVYLEVAETTSSTEADVVCEGSVCQCEYQSFSSWF